MILKCCNNCPNKVAILLLSRLGKCRSLNVSADQISRRFIVSTLDYGTCREHIGWDYEDELDPGFFGKQEDSLFRIRVRKKIRLFRLWLRGRAVHDVPSTSKTWVRMLPLRKLAGNESKPT